MRVFYTFSMAILSGVLISLNADELAVKNQNISLYVNTLRKSAPEITEKFEETFLGRFNDQDIDAALYAMRQMRNRLGKEHGSVAEIRNFEDGYRAAWNITLYIFKKTQSSEMKKRINEEWDSSLTMEESLVVSQITALQSEWHREMLTDNFWNLISEESDITIIKAISFVLYAHGNESDRMRLQEYLQKTENTQKKEVMQNAINWMKFKAIDDRDSPGPASVPPTLVYASSSDEFNMSDKPDLDQKNKILESKESDIARPQKEIINILGEPSGKGSGGSIEEKK